MPELMPIPAGQTFTEERRKLAGLVDSDGFSQNLDVIRKADTLIQTAKCVGGLACCEGCEVVGTQDGCPVAMVARERIITTVLKKPIIPGVPSEASVLVQTMDWWDDKHPVPREEYRDDVKAPAPPNREAGGRAITMNNSDRNNHE